MGGSETGASSVSLGRNPWVGPRPLEIGETLYGRDREVDELYYLFAAERVVLLHSPSGAGKSSLVQAGLVPRLRQRFDVWRPTRLNQEPRAGEAAANRYVLSALRGFEEGIPEDLRSGAGVLAGRTLADYVESRARRPAAPESVALVFDQFEEVLTVDPLAIEAKREFFDQLGELLRRPRVWALFVLREDYLAPLDPYARQVPTHLKVRFRLDLLDLDGAREAMVEPARRGGREFPAAERLARDLAATKVQQPDGSVVEQTGRHVEPVQLQVVCRRLWQAMPEDAPAIETGHLEELGDVTSALAAYYADSVTRVAGGDPAREREIREWFDERLITAGGTRGQVLRGAEASDGLANDLVEALRDTHLVRAEQRAGATWYELAHDRLIEPVTGDNAAWREEHLAEVQRRATFWEREDRPAALLLADAELAGGEAWAASAPVVTEVEERFLEASRQAQEARERDRRQALWIRRLAVAATLVSVLAILAGAFARRQWLEAEAQTARARDLARASTASNLLAAGDTLRGNLVALEVLRPRATPTAVETLHQALAGPVESAVLGGHDGMVRSAAWSPDGSRVLTASEDSRARILSAVDGALLAVLEGHSGPVLAAAWSPDGGRIATASADSTVRVWDAGGGEGAILEGHGDRVVAVAWSPDGGRLASASEDSTARLWDPDAGEAVVLAGHRDWVEAAAWSPDGGRVVTASRDATAAIWEAASGRRLAVLSGHAGRLYGAAWSPDGDRVATASQDGTARLWDAASGASTAVLAGHGGAALAVAWSPAGERIATASLDRTARLWDAGGAPVATLQRHGDWVAGVAWSPDGRRLVTASYDGTARLWAAADGAAVGVLAGHADAVRAASFGPGGLRVVTASLDRTARVWHVAEGEAIARLEGHQLGVEAAAWSPDGNRVVTASRDGTARLWAAATGEVAAVLAGHASPVASAAWSPDGRRVATASSDNTGRVWDAGGGSPVVLEGHEGWLEEVAWSPDGERLATASRDGTARVWDPRGGAALAVLEGHREWVHAALWSPDGRRLLTVSADATARLWDPVTGDELAFLAGHVEAVQTAAWSPGGERFATASRDKTARIWNATGELVAALEGHEKTVSDVAWSPDGARLVTASLDGTARLWDGAGAPGAKLRGHREALRAVAWSPDGRRIATASLDRTVRLWDAATGEAVATLEGHSDSIAGVAWSPDASRLVTASRDSTARVWANADDYPAYLMARARARTRLCLDADFRRQSLGEDAAAAEGRAAACEACVGVFFDRVEGVPLARWPGYVAAWKAYRECLPGAR